MARQENYYFRWEKWRKANENFRLPGGHVFGSYFSETIPETAVEADYNEVYSCYDRNIKGRRMITTSDGYLGWASDNVYGSESEQRREGDLIPIIFGCSTPILLRPCGEHSLVVREAYVHGLMDGEAMSFLKAGSCQMQDFTLC